MTEEKNERKKLISNNIIVQRLYLVIACILSGAYILLGNFAFFSVLE